MPAYIGMGLDRSANLGEELLEFGGTEIHLFEISQHLLGRIFFFKTDVNDGRGVLANAPDGERYLFQNVNVLAVGSTPAPQPGENTTAAATPTAGGGLMTFAVPPNAAAKIALANGVYLTLVPPGNQPVAVPPVTPGNLFSGPLTPYA